MNFKYMYIFYRSNFKLKKIKVINKNGKIFFEKENFLVLNDDSLINLLIR